VRQQALAQVRPRFPVALWQVLEREPEWEPEQPPLMVRERSMGLSLAQPRSDPQALQWLRGLESHCWPADFASCNHRQAADLPGRMEGASEKRDSYS
jgi:hypothetical protein